MRRKDKKITDPTWIDNLIRNSQICRIATAREGCPYIIPISFGYDGECLYFHSAKEGMKIEYFRANAKVCFEFEGKVDLIKDSEKACNWTFDYESVIGFGQVIELKSNEEKFYGLNQIMLNYSKKKWTYTEAELQRVKVWKIIIESVSGKRSESKSL